MAERGKYMAGCPIVLTLGTAQKIRYRVYTGNNLDTIIHVGYVYSPDGGVATIDISELFAGLRETAGVVLTMVVVVDDEGNNYEGEADGLRKHEFYVYGGGISNMLLRVLSQAQTTIFDYKLKNGQGNFLLTSRTNNLIIPVPEDELMPMAYYGTGMEFDIRHDGELIAHINHSAETSESLHELDFAALRLQAATSLNRLVDYFRITTTTGFSCMVLLTTVDRPSALSLVFLNSWGVWEKMSIKGVTVFAPSVTESVKKTSIDADTKNFVTENMPTTYRNKYKADMGYRTYDERMMLLGVVARGKAKLSGGGMQFGVNVTGDMGDLSGNDFLPRKVQLELEMHDEEMHYSPVDMEQMFNVLTSGEVPVGASGSNILV